MKLSKFNVYVNYKNSLLIYNTLSGGILKLTDPYAGRVCSLQQERIFKDEKTDLFKNLKQGEMIIEEDVNELEYLKAHNTILRFSSASYGLTIAPTMKCNFRCPYCYEKGYNLHTMTPEIVNKTKEFIQNLKSSAKFLSISWYGGEPLLAMDIIRELSETAIDTFGDDYEASMVTNGYLLNEKNIQYLKDIRVKDIQITIDGPPDIHNSLRKLPNGEDTFFVIIKNIQQALRNYPELKITIRVNTDKNNIKRVDEILDYLQEYHLKDKIHLYLAPIDNINDTCNSAFCFNTEEFAQEQLRFVKRNLKKGYQFAYLPSANLYICGAVSINSCIIDPLGNLYKCWDDIGRQEYIAGNLETGLSKCENTTKWLNYDFLAEKCKGCAFLPLCMGGCPNYKIRSEENKCLPIKENAVELVKLLYDIKKENKDEHNTETYDQNS